MNILGIRVKHDTLGVGMIVEHDADYFTVEFASKTSKFVYPDAFTKFIEADDVAVQTSILKEIDDAKAAVEEKQRAEEAARKITEEHKELEGMSKKATTNKLAHITRPQRVSGKPMVFFVFQGNTFDKESKGGYIWAPIINKAGSTIHHWDRLLDVRAGDIILHGCDGNISAISTARDKCYECKQPEELLIEDLWDRYGRRVDCDYIVIQQPIRTANYKDDIISLSTAKYSPFDRDGDGNMGYLYEINRDLAHIFVRESVKVNKYLLDYEVISKFLNEETTKLVL